MIYRYVWVYIYIYILCYMVWRASLMQVHKSYSPAEGLSKGGICRLASVMVVHDSHSPADGHQKCKCMNPTALQKGCRREGAADRHR